jgi:Asp-tRNA(Asn)/Glu-tRNA(Gln) amidotransferase A subunit family amidase
MNVRRLRDWLSADADTRRAALQSCLARIDEADSTIHAWVQVCPQPSAGTGPLAGVPFGAKDIIETKGLATEYGSPIYKGRTGNYDAAIVQDLRARGAVLLGKTQTTAFAYLTPGPTRNPINPAHTPGGSSSGSAAAVSAGMAPFALGTQTRGSVLRPASYCGVTGFKPTFGSFSMEGVLAFAPSLDTLGFFTNTPEDMLLLWECLGQACAHDEELVFAVPNPAPVVEPEMASAFHNAVSAFSAAGLSVQSVDLSPMLAELSEANYTVMFYEAAALFADRYSEYGDRLDRVADAVRRGMQISEAQYDDARRFILACTARITELSRTTPVFLVPAATGPAPHGLSFTGDSSMNAPWTAMGTPAISIPLPVSSGLPLGLQLTAAPGDDARLLRAASRVHRLFKTP